MRRLIVPLLLVAVTAFLYRDRWLPQPPGQSGYLGYVEGETILIGAPQAGRIFEMEAIKGHAVNTGEVLFALDPAQAAPQRNDAQPRQHLHAAHLVETPVTGKRLVATVAGQRHGHL